MLLMLICILTTNVITSCSFTMMLFLHLDAKPLMTLSTVLYLSCTLISGHLPMMLMLLNKNVITSFSDTMMLLLHFEVNPLMMLTTVLFLSCGLIAGPLGMMLIELKKRRSASFLVVFNRPINVLCRVSLFLSMVLCFLLRLFVFRLLRLKRFSTLTLKVL